jgi:hypothetical protein
MLIFIWSALYLFSICFFSYDPVKVNCVVMRGVNDNEIVDFVRWTEKLPVSTNEGHWNRLATSTYPLTTFLVLI